MLLINEEIASLGCWYFAIKIVDIFNQQLKITFLKIVL